MFAIMYSNMILYITTVMFVHLIQVSGVKGEVHVKGYSGWLFSAKRVTIFVSESLVYS